MLNRYIASLPLPSDYPDALTLEMVAQIRMRTRPFYTSTSICEGECPSSARLVLIMMIMISGVIAVFIIMIITTATTTTTTATTTTPMIHAQVYLPTRSHIARRAKTNLRPTKMKTMTSQH